MGWSGSLTSSSAVGASITYTPDYPENTSPKTNWVNANTYAGNYSVSSFKAPKKGIYRFVLKGSGGVSVTVNRSDTSALEGGSSGGTGGTTTGYLLLEANQTVYVGAGGVCRAAFVSSATGSSLSAIAASNLYFVAGAGGSGGAYSDDKNRTAYNCKTEKGGQGGGAAGVSGTASMSSAGGVGGSQSSGGAAGKNTNQSSGTNYSDGSAGAYGKGGNGGTAGNPSNNDYYADAGRGGDGYYGGGGGACSAADGGVTSAGGGGGSGYVKTASFTCMGVTYTSSTSAGGGASANAAGSVVVTYYAQADPPVYFRGIQLSEIYFNGTKLGGLIYDGTRIFARRCAARMRQRLSFSAPIRRAALQG